MPGRSRSWTDSDFIAAVARNSNFTDVLRELGLRPAGGNHRSMKQHAERSGVDQSRFSDERRVRGLRVIHERRAIPGAEVFSDHSRVSQHIVRRHALRKLRPVVCAGCGDDGWHNGMPLPLQLDHINGVVTDNRYENLRWLCPNCHSQTETFAGRKTATAPPAARAASRRLPNLLSLTRLPGSSNG
jgi:hypothetical protein